MTATIHHLPKSLPPKWRKPAGSYVWRSVGPQYWKVHKGTLLEGPTVYKEAIPWPGSK